MYELALADFPVKGNNHLAVSVRHQDAAGYVLGWWRTLAHQDSPAPGSLEITVTTPTPGNAVALRAVPQDPNGAGRITYQWQGVLNETVQTGTDLLGATLATYSLPATGLAPNAYVKLKALVHDVFGGRTTLMSPPLRINEPPTGLIWVEAPPALTPGATVRLRTEALFDPNGGIVTNFAWYLDNQLIQTTTTNIHPLTAPQTEALTGGAILAVVATHLDDLGFSARLTASMSFTAPPTVEILGDAVFADGNRYTAVLTRPQSPAPAAGGYQLANVPPLPTNEYQWGYSETRVTTHRDAAGNVNLITMDSGFIPLVNQTNSIYIMTASIFQHGKKLMVMAMQINSQGLAVGAQAIKTIDNEKSDGQLNFALSGYSSGRSRGCHRRISGYQWNHRHRLAMAKRPRGAVHRTN